MKSTEKLYSKIKEGADAQNWEIAKEQLKLVPNIYKPNPEWMNMNNRTWGNVAFEVIYVAMNNLDLTQIHAALGRRSKNSAFVMKSGYSSQENFARIELIADNQQDINDYKKLLVTNGFELQLNNK